MHNADMKKNGVKRTRDNHRFPGVPTYRSFLRGEKPKRPDREFITPKRERKTERMTERKRPAAVPQGSWGAVAAWYAKHLESPDTYHAKVVLPNLLRLVDPKPDERILDIACGEGFFSRALRARGAQVEGVDIGAELIKIAKQKNPEIPFHIGPAEELRDVPDNAFDQAIIVLAIQNIADVDRVCAAAARVLRPGGSFHIVMNHPAFRIPRHSRWEYHEKSRTQSRCVDRYLSESSATVEMHPGIMGSPKTISFHRPLQYYVKALAKTGFVIDRLEEWISHKRSDSGPRAAAENASRKEIPLFLYVRAKKDVSRA